MTNYYSAGKLERPNILSVVDSMLEQRKVQSGEVEASGSSVPKPNETQVHQYHQIRESLEKKHEANAHRIWAP